jgi:phage shock protein PspC (stress-responsive transcriptional regulator)
MKEITRIHIAKMSYDVEIEAKKELEAYLKALETSSGDTDIMNDIEIRITEILAERGVQKNGVVTEDDVAALRKQLGEPREFMTDGDASSDEEEAEDVSSESGRKLFRDTDHGVLGGVLAGIAAFTKVDIIWVRLIFIVIALASFGTALLVYVVLWLAVPPARTAADKLQMSGRPVTVSAIRALNENEAGKPAKTNSNGQRVALSLLGVIFSFGALIAAGVITAALAAVVFAGRWQEIEGMAGTDFFKAAFTLGIASGVLFIALMVLSAYASFARKLTKRVAISGAAIIVIGLVLFTVGLGLARYGGEQNRQQIKENTQEAVLTLPANARSSAALSVTAPGMTVEYIVDETRAPRASTQLFAYAGHALPKVTAAMKDGTLLVIAAETSDESPCTHVWCVGNEQKVTVYGPALKNLTAGEDTTLRYQSGKQRNLMVDAKENASVEVTGGTIEGFSITAAKDSSVIAAGATVQNVTSHLGASAQLELGTVKSLAITDDNSCPSNDREARVSVSDVTSGDMMFNGEKQPVKTIDSGCTEIDIEREDYSDRR